MTRSAKLRQMLREAREFEDVDDHFPWDEPDPASEARSLRECIDDVRLGIRGMDELYDLAGLPRT